MLKVENLRKKYKDREVLNIHSMEIKEMELVGLVGNNGAGKTTLFKLLLDLIEPTSGSVKIKGIEVSNNTTWKNFTSAYIDHTFLIGFLKPEEYFEFIAAVNNISKSELAERLQTFDRFFNDEILGQAKFLSEFSTGNQHKIGIAGALLNNPELVILDEPFANLDPYSQAVLKEVITEYNKKFGTAFFISSHNLDLISDLCGRIILISQGEVRKDMQKDVNTLALLKEYFSRQI